MNIVPSVLAKKVLYCWSQTQESSFWKTGRFSFKEFCYDVRPVVIAEAGVLDADVIAVLGSITFARKILAIDGVTVASVAGPGRILIEFRLATFLATLEGCRMWLWTDFEVMLALDLPRHDGVRRVVVNDGMVEQLTTNARCEEQNGPKFQHPCRCLAFDVSMSNIRLSVRIVLGLTSEKWNWVSPRKPVWQHTRYLSHATVYVYLEAPYLT